MMKKVSIVIFFLVGYLAFSESKVDLDFSEKKMKTENTIRDQITAQLLPFFGPEDFNILVNSEIRLGELEKKSEEEIQKINEEAIDKKENLTLPGFEDGNESAFQAKEKIRYYSFLEIVKVEVTLVVDESLKAERKELAKEIVSEKINSSFGSKSSFKFSEAKLHRNQSTSEAITAYIRNHKDIILLFSVFVFAMMLIFTIFNRMIASRDAHNMRALTSLSKSSMASVLSSREPKEKDEVTREKYIEALMNYVRDEPFVARASFENFTMEEKSAIISSVETDLLKKSLLTMMKIEEKDVDHQSDEQKRKMSLKSVLDQMKESVSIQKVLMNQRFGYLNYLEPNEVLSILEEDKTPRSLAIVSQFMPSSKYYEFSKLIDEETKVEIFKILNNKENPVSEEEKKDLDKKLKSSLEIYADKILSSASADNSALENFLNNDPKISNVVNALKKDSSFEFTDELNKYTLSYVDILKDNFEAASSIIMNEDNDVVAASIFPLEEGEKNIVLNKFGKMRKEIVETLLKNTKFSEEDVDKAQAKILKSFREKV